MCILLLGDSSADVKVLGEIWAEHDDALLAMEAMMDQGSEEGSSQSPGSEGSRASSMGSRGALPLHPVHERASSYNTFFNQKQNGQPPRKSSLSL